MSDLTSRRVPPGPILRALREHRFLPDWALDVPRLAIEHALGLAGGDPAASCSRRTARSAWRTPSAPRPLRLP
ncbi:hypothetical protein NKG05_28460 [Oerskovia sp. M15]